MNIDPSESGAPVKSPTAATSELNNLLEIISGTSAAIENIWDGNDGSQKYFDMLRTSVDRAAQVTAQLVEHAGGSDKKVLFHPELAAFAKPKDPPAPASTQQKRSLLVVDDEPMALILAKQVLSEAGFEVVTAQSGFECLDLFRKRQRPFDLILLDLNLQGMDGMTCLTGVLERPEPEPGETRGAQASQAPEKRPLGKTAAQIHAAWSESRAASDPASAFAKGIAERGRQPPHVLPVILIAVALSDENFPVRAVPRASPVLVGPAQAERERGLA
jgi:CheY-like chemotaxis protein